MKPFIFITAALVLFLAGAAAVFSGLVLAWVIAGALVLYLILIGFGVFSLGLGMFVRAICRGPAQSGAAALTFDDGPDPEATPALLDLLDRRQVRAAFFCVGNKVRAHPELVKEMALRGHTVGNHTMDHHWGTNFLLGSGMHKQIAQAQEAISDAGAPEPVWFRPPMGLSNPHLAGALEKAGLACVGWDVRAYDRKGPAGKIRERVLARAGAGSIIVLHEGGAEPRRLVNLVDGIISGLEASGLDLVSLDQLLMPDLPGSGKGL